MKRTTVIFFALLFQVACAHTFLVTRVVDGDTLVLNKTQTVRLIGIDTPELHESQKLERDVARSGQSKAHIQALGQEASDFTRTLVLGQKVRLQYDHQRTDKYGRMLAYVFLQDGTFVNEELIKAGYARGYFKFPFQYSEQFKKDEETAKIQLMGIWKHSSIP